MKLNYCFICFLLFGVGHTKLSAQNEVLSQFLDSISAHSPILGNAKTRLDWQESESRTNILPSDPIVDYAYLRGPGNIGKSTELNISQSLEFPTTYVRKFAVSKQERKLFFADYRLKSNELKNLIFNLLVEREMLLSKSKIIEQMTLDSKRALEAANRLFASGVCSQMEVTAAKRVLIESESRYEKIRLDIYHLYEKIVWMTGQETSESKMDLWSKRILLLANQIQVEKIKADQSMEVQLQSEKIFLARQKLLVAKSTHLPNFTIGYRQEYGDGLKFKGVLVGVTIPIFNHVNQVKSAQKECLMQESDYQIKLDDAAIGLQKLQQQWEIIDKQEKRYIAFLKENPTELLLVKSMESGQISITEWIRQREKCLDDRLQLLDLQLQKLNLTGSILLWL